jgi:hypothetical protein
VGKHIKVIRKVVIGGVFKAPNTILKPEIQKQTGGFNKCESLCDCPGKLPDFLMR